MKNGIIFKIQNGKQIFYGSRLEVKQYILQRLHEGRDVHGSILTKILPNKKSFLMNNLLSDLIKECRSILKYG